MFILDVGVESRVAKIPFAADADVVAFHRVVSGSAFAPGHELLLTLVITLLLVHIYPLFINCKYKRRVCNDHLCLTNIFLSVFS